MRRFVKKQGKKQLFWNLYSYIARMGYSVSSGTDSGPGNVEDVRRHYPEDIKGEIERLIAEKLADGYVEVTDAPWHGGYESPLRTALEDTLAENPDDAATHMAYADHLMELGDPRGEFIQVQLALEDESLPTAERKKLKRREKALLKKHVRSWLGPLAGFWLDKMDKEDGDNAWEPMEYRWRRGWIDSLWFHDGWGGVQAALAWTPMLRCLRELRILYGSYDDDRYGYGDLSGGGFFGNVRVFQIASSEHNQNYFGETARASDFYRSMPRLEQLHIYNGDHPFHDDFPHLRQLTVYHGRYIYPLAALAEKASMKNLTHLSLWPRSLANESPYMIETNEDGGLARITRSGAAALFRSPNFPHLQHLLLRNSDIGDEGIRILIESGLLKRLRSLDLLGGCITDTGARMLAECPEVRKLDSLNLSHNMLTRTGITALRATGVSLKVDDQHGLGALETGEYLYEGDRE